MSAFEETIDATWTLVVTYGFRTCRRFNLARCG